METNGYIGIYRAQGLRPTMLPELPTVVWTMPINSGAIITKFQP